MEKTIQQSWGSIVPCINDRLVKVLTEDLGFQYIMPVQKVSIPYVLMNKDVAVEAITGSGKTLCFLIPVFHKLLLKKEVKKNQLFALIILPTKELADQIYKISLDINLFLKTDYKTQLLIGGQNEEKDLKNIDEGCNILIGTPGKLGQIFEHPNFSDKIQLNKFEMLIIDEADRLNSQQYKQNLQSVFRKLPKQRRTCIFSATLKKDQMKQFYKDFGLLNPVAIQLKNQDQIKDNTYSIPEKLQNYYFKTKNREEKIKFVYNFIQKAGPQKILMFFNTCDSVQYYYHLFSRVFSLQHLKLFQMHRQMKQKNRNKIMQNFIESEENQLNILLCTDVLARGIDFQNIKQIIQIDVPQDPDFYIHRIGRTARNYSSGQALLLLEESEMGYIEYLKLKDVKIELQNDVYTQDIQYNIQETCQNVLIADMAMVERSTKGFISFLRSYKEHQLQYILNVKNLNLASVANSFFLLKLPWIKELKITKDQNLPGFTPYDINIKDIKFKDQNQENIFKAKLNEKQQKIKENKKIDFENDQKIKRKIKNTGNIRRKIKREHNLDEHEEYQKELKLIKKLQSGKIDIEQFNVQCQQFQPSELNNIKLTKKDVLSTCGSSRKK